MRRFLETDFGQHFRQFEQFGYLQRALGEQNSGVGLGICLRAEAHECEQFTRFVTDALLLLAHPARDAFLDSLPSSNSTVHAIPTNVSDHHEAARQYGTYQLQKQSP